MKNDGIIVSESHGGTSRELGSVRNLVGWSRGQVCAGHTLTAEVPILAEFTVEIASCGSERQDRYSRKKMKERLFFDRINTKTAGIPVALEFKLTAVALPEITVPAKSLADNAVARAKVALDLSMVKLVPESGSLCDGSHALYYARYLKNLKF